MIDSLAEPVNIDGYKLTVATSIGVAIYPRDGGDGRTLLKNADVALYRATSEGRGTFRFFQAQMNASVQERPTIEHDLQNALKDNRLDVYFQPQFACDTLAVVGFEALVRWIDPARGMIPPSTFIPIAEAFSLIEHVGQFVLERACALAATWGRVAAWRLILPRRSSATATSPIYSPTSYAEAGCRPPCSS